MTIYSLDVLLLLFGPSLLFQVQFWLLVPDQHTGFSGGRSGGLVFPSLSEFSTVYCDPHSTHTILRTYYCTYYHTILSWPLRNDIKSLRNHKSAFHWEKKMDILVFTQAVERGVRRFIWIIEIQMEESGWMAQLSCEGFVLLRGPQKDYHQDSTWNNKMMLSEMKSNHSSNSPTA